MKTSSLPSLRFAPVRRFSSTAVALSAAIACGSPSNNSALFGTGSAHSVNSAGSAGTNSSGSQSPGGAGSAGTGISSSASANGAGLGAGSGVNPNASGGPGGSGEANADLPSAGNTGAGGSTLGDCAAHGPDATHDSGTQHCYLVVTTLSTYAAAQAHCVGLGAHLATIVNEAENGFVWSLDTNEHWIGASDHRGPKETEPGTYTWLTGEPFSYTAWSAGQPNASKTTCGDANGGGDCYEHCAFQWTYGEHAGQWNDRYCLHTIESVCEWDE